MKMPRPCLLGDTEAYEELLQGKRFHLDPNFLNVLKLTEEEKLKYGKDMETCEKYVNAVKSEGGYRTMFVHKRSFDEIRADPHEDDKYLLVSP